MPTLEDIPWKVIITLFALIGPTNHLPALMCAIVTISEIFHRLLHLYHMFRAGHCILRLVTRQDLFRSSHKTGFIPLGAVTRLPALSADVAELSATKTAGTFVSQYETEALCRKRTSYDCTPRLARQVVYNCSTAATPALWRLLAPAVLQCLRGTRRRD